MAYYAHMPILIKVVPNHALSSSTVNVIGQPSSVILATMSEWQLRFVQQFLAKMGKGQVVSSREVIMVVEGKEDIQTPPKR